MNPQQKRRAKAKREYAAAGPAFLAAHPVCEIQAPGCTQRATERSHIVGNGRLASFYSAKVLGDDLKESREIKKGTIVIGIFAVRNANRRFEWIRDAGAYLSYGHLKSWNELIDTSNEYLGMTREFMSRFQVDCDRLNFAASEQTMRVHSNFCDISILMERIINFSLALPTKSDEEKFELITDSLRSFLKHCNNVDKSVEDLSHFLGDRMIDIRKIPPLE